MSPLKSLYYFAPICLLLNLALLLPLEGFQALREISIKLGWWIVTSNASLTFGLNLSAVMLIGLSSMVLSLSKVVKDVLMVVAPALLLGESVRRLDLCANRGVELIRRDVGLEQLTATQGVGYGIATVRPFLLATSRYSCRDR